MKTTGSGRALCAAACMTLLPATLARAPQPARAQNAQMQSAAPRGTLVVSAAASLKNALSEISRRYTARRRAVTVRHNFASSGALQQQIERGAPVDVFIAASDKNMNALAAKSLVARGTRRVLAGNALVLIVPRDGRNTVRGFADLARSDVRRVAIGAPASVPAGQYAEQVLKKLKLWNRVRPKALQAKDVREVLTQVELGNVDAGLVYRTDAAISRRVRVVAAASPRSHRPINYPLAVVAAARNPNAARDYAAFLVSPSARAVLRKYGFTVPRGQG